MSTDVLVSLVAAVSAIVFDWFPPVKDWFDKFEPGQKRGLMAALMLVLVGGAFGLACAHLYAGLVCTQQGALDALKLLVMAVVINQGVHFGTKPTAK